MNVVERVGLDVIDVKIENVTKNKMEAIILIVSSLVVGVFCVGCATVCCCCCDSKKENLIVVKNYHVVGKDQQLETIVETA